MAAKRCPHCGETKPLSGFARDRWKASGHKSWCLVCDCARAKRYYAAHRERAAAYYQQRKRQAS